MQGIGPYTLKSSRVFMNSFNQHASSYHKNTPVQKQMAQDLYTAMQKHIPHWGSVFEFGAGTGHLSHQILQHAGVHKMQIADQSLAMLFQNQIQAPPHKVETDFMEMDVASGEIPTCYDIYTSNACIQWIQDLTSFAEKLKTAIPPGSYWAFTTFARNHFYEFYESYLASTLQPFPVPISLYNLREIEELMYRNGFALLFSKNQQETVPHSSLHDIFKNIKSMGAFSNGSSLPLPYKCWSQNYQDLFGKTFPLTWSWSTYVFQRSDSLFFSEED